MSDAIYCRANLIQKPSGTPPGFPMAEFVGELRPELQTPLAERLVTDLNTALVQQFLNVSVAEREAVVQPNCMLNNRHGESVAVGFGCGHSRSAYLGLVKATQPLDVLHTVEHGKLTKGPPRNSRACRCG